MCGIAGIVGSHDRAYLERVIRMTDCMSHRGPDGYGTVIDEEHGFAFGHRRLAILDLSEAAAQPIRSDCGHYLLSFNGEIYNYQQLAERYDIKCTSSGDTELLLRLLVAHGADILGELNGMFSLAFIDIRTSEVLLARDHIGIKPMYYLTDAEVIHFASEMKAFKHIEHDFTEDPIAIRQFLELGFFPKESTIYQGVKKLLPGHYLKFSRGKQAVLHSYLDQGSAYLDVSVDMSDPISSFEQVFQDSVSDRLISDRPSGVFLSGGTDSSLVAAFARKIVGPELETYSIKVKDALFDESTYADSVAKHLGTKHLTIEVDQQEMKDGLVERLDGLDEPFGDSSYLPFHLLSERAVQSITVALSGDGADELFQGYGVYKWASRLHDIPGLFHPLLKHGLKTFPPSKSKEHWRYFEGSTGERRFQQLFSTEQNNYRWSEIQDLCPADKREERITYHQDQVDPGLHPREVMAHLDRQNYLIDDLLSKVDRASMANSLEVRVPFLDRRLIQFSNNLSLGWKVKQKEHKYLLKKVLEKSIPSELVYRKKWGFSIPLQKWLREDFAFLCEEAKASARKNRIESLNSDEVCRWIDAYLYGKEVYYQRVWLLVQLYRWADKHHLT